MNKFPLKSLILGALALTSISAFGQMKAVNSAELLVGRGDAESVLEAKTEIDKAYVHETTKDMYKMWLMRAIVYSRVVDNKANPLFAGVTDGAGYVSAYSMMRFWKSADLKKTYIETGKYETVNSFSVAFNEGEDMVSRRYYDSGVKYFQLLLFLHGKMDTADVNTLERKNSITKKYLTDRLATIASQSTNNMVKIEALTELVDDGSKSPLVFEALSRAYMEKGDTVTAERVVRQGLAAAPGDNNMFQILINYYITVNRIDLLFVDVNKQITLNPTSQLYSTRGYLWESTKDNYDSAIVDYRRALALDEFNYDANYNLGVALLKHESRKLYEKKAMANAATKAEIDAKLKALFTEARTLLELASENKEYDVKDQLNIFKALKTAALELDDKEGADIYDAKIKVLESLK